MHVNVVIDQPTLRPFFGSSTIVSLVYIHKCTSCTANNYMRSYVLGEITLTLAYSTVTSRMILMGWISISSTLPDHSPWPLEESHWSHQVNLFTRQIKPSSIKSSQNLCMSSTLTNHFCPLTLPGFVLIDNSFTGQMTRLRWLIYEHSTGSMRKYSSGPGLHIWWLNPMT